MITYLEHIIHTDEELESSQKKRLSTDFRGPKMPIGAMELSPYNK